MSNLSKGAYIVESVSDGTTYIEATIYLTQPVLSFPKYCRIFSNAFDAKKYLVQSFGPGKYNVKRERDEDVQFEFPTGASNE